MIHFADQTQAVADDARKGFFNIDLTEQRGRQR
jgi:hypothetical protein